MLEAMKQFVCVVEAGSFSRASERLSRNASSVARQIDKLEAELGTKLFIRSTRRLDLTLQGQTFYEQCLGIVQSFDQAKDAFAQTPASISGEVRLTVFDSYGNEKVVPLLPEFQKRYPKARVAVSLDNQMTDLNDGVFDIAIRHGKPADSNLIYKPLEASRAVLLASPEYITSSPAITTPEDLKQHPCLTLYRQRSQTYWYFQRGNERKKLRIDSALSSCGGAPIATWAAQGCGVTLLATWYAQRFLERGELVQILPEWQASLSEGDDQIVYLLWTAAKAQRPVVRALIDFLREHLVPTQA